MRRICIILISFYRKFLSPLKGKPTCRFYPSCSAYAIRAFEEWGLIRGGCMTAWRLLRCQPFSRGGYDPVFPHKSRPDRISAQRILPLHRLPFLPEESAPPGQ
ncbi:MAG: membrane protein insertion efficiency factor YidD [Clostridia bacterium]|nr:membrane protein insertion efficiency factor YidD [Clostridia bacterium]MBO5670414.1 membrane protein insertion efficiency factor YidD [Clostridia bacterium]